jgi:hypothetical protein
MTEGKSSNEPRTKRSDGANQEKRCKVARGPLNAALLIGRSLGSEWVCYIGGVAKAKYTTPHDIALR